MKEEAKKLFQKDLQQCIDFIVSNTDDKILVKDLTLLSARYSQVKSEAERGIISNEDKTLALNRISNSVLSHLDEIDNTTDNKTGIFISHAPEDAKLALAVEKYINEASHGKINVISNESLQQDLEKNTPTRDRELIYNAINKSEILIIIITPGSNERPLLVWESGFAYGKDKRIIYLSYFVRLEHIHPVFEINTKSNFNGEAKDEIFSLTEEIAKLHGENVSEKLKKYWEFVIIEYLNSVANEKEVSFSKRLFHNHFHQGEIASKISGTWYAKWTQIYDDGKEDIWEIDTLHIWSSENRLRIIGFNNKTNIEVIKAENSGYYPMEGVVSWKGWVALSYWSAGNIPICGTCLMKPMGLTGELLEGKWQGFTAKDIKKEPKYSQGRVVWGKNKEDIENYFEEL